MMNQFLKQSLFAFLICLSASINLNGQSYWKPWQENEDVVKGTRYIKPTTYQTAALDVAALRAVLQTAPLEFSTEATENKVIINLPSPDGSLAQFSIVESAVMHPDLQAKYPEIRCYSGYNIAQPHQTLKCDLTPKGFHAMVLGTEEGTWFIDPYSFGDTEYYTIYNKKDYQKTSDFTCQVEHDPLADIKLNASAESAGDCMFRTYRLALACTGEYAAFHGGTVAGALAAMNTSINRINGVYEKEIAVRLLLIANNNLLVYLDAASDPFANTNGNTMLGQNQTNTTTVIGAANYDFGHVFSTGGGGVASLGSVCSATNKARGVTGSGQPIGDAFDIDYVAHEMGHQLGGSHTFYNSCGGNISMASAFEPGSGTTIMAYAGICAPNVQNNSDAYFHARSLQQIGTFLSAGGNACATKIAITNSKPTVEAGANFSIPGGTPFVLTAIGNDNDIADPLTYCWEQMNNDAGGAQPPAAANTAGPMFRSLSPVASPMRFFPPLANVIAGTTNTWQVLPTMNRTLDFRVTIRDNASPAGCTAEDNMVVNVVGTAGPFIVTAPNTAVVWNVGEPQTVTWNIANTDIAPINASQVKISLSTDGGLTYPVVLADGVPNNGSALISVPNNPSTTCRVKVEGKGNIFYDISNTNFRIQIPPTPTFVLASVLAQTNACAGQNFTFNVTATGILGFSTPVQLSVTGLPPGVNASFSANPLSPTGTATVTLSGFNSANSGPLSFTVTGVAGAITQNSVQNIQIFPSAPNVTTQLTPIAAAVGLAPNLSLTWSAAPLATKYHVQVATNVAFAAGDMIKDEMLTGTSLVLNGLLPTTVYFWRVRAANDCGDSPFTSARTFQTSACSSFSNTTPVIIPDVIGNAISTITASGGTISDINVSTVINHSWIGDIDAKLTSPSGATVTLFTRPGNPATNDGCTSDNMVVTFEDQATMSATVLESTCNTTPPAISGTFQPVQPLSGFTGANAQGTWSLIVNDFVNVDGGSIVSWNIDLCFSAGTTNLALVTNQALQLPQGQSAGIGNNLLSATASGAAANIKFMVLSPVTGGVLKLNGTNLGLGSLFSQADINSGLLSYQHAGGAGATDQFIFQVTETGGTGWVNTGTFQINIVQNNLTGSAVLTQGINCFNQNNAVITVNSQGGNGAVTYSLNGGPQQASNVFGSLPAGNYSVTIRDNAGFTLTTNTITVGNPQQLTLNASVSNNQITLNASGGTGALTYALNGGAAQASNTFGSLPNGVYNAVVTDANGCTQTTQAVVAVNSLVTGAAIQSQITCNGANNGSIQVTVGGGQMPYTFTLSIGTVQVGNGVFTGLAPGNYTVAVIDQQGFNATTNTVVLVAPNPITASASANLNTITVNASGGTGNLQYSLSGGPYQTSNIFSGLQNSTYTISIQDANGCLANTQATVAVAPVSVVAQVGNTIACFGQSTGSIIANGTGGIAPLNYQLNGGGLQASNTFTGLPSGTYTITVIDATAAQASTTVTIGQPGPITASAAVNLNQITVNAAGGTTPYTYSLNGGAAQTSQVFSSLPNGNYSLVITDANGCSTQVGANIAVPALNATASISGTILCTGGQTLTLTVNNPTGGFPPYTYALNNGPAQSSPVFTNLGAGTYTVVMLDSNGGSLTLPANTGTEPSSLTGIVTVTLNVAQAAATGGTAPYQYSLNGSPAQSSSTFPNLAMGMYPGIVITDANGCTVTTPGFTVSVGTQNLVDAFGIEIAPNPSTGTFQLRFNEPNTSDLWLRVSDVLGRAIVLEQVITSGNQVVTINLDQVATGTYLLSITGDGKAGAAAIVILR
jgi:subtilisin-like proprotein convertase family protein